MTTVSRHRHQEIVAPATRRVTSRRLPRRYLQLDVIRALRNPWTTGFAVFMPVAMYLLFGVGADYGAVVTPRGTVSGMIMANMALFGAITAAVNVAGSVSDERSFGWNRQLRLTPLSPAVYVVSKLLASLVTGFIVVSIVTAVGLLTGARIVQPFLVGAFLFCWLAGTVMFAAFGLAVGYLFKGEAVLGVVGPLLSLFAFFGGLFIPLDSLGGLRLVAPYTPMYGLRSLLASITLGAPVETVAVAGALGWTTLFIAVALWRYRRVAGRE